MHLPARLLHGITISCLLIVLFAISGCGSVDWFPEYKRLPTTPDAFTFADKNDVALNTATTSDAITVSGLTAESAPISITGPSGSNSKYTINTGTATDAEGTVKNGDKVTVTHTSSTLPGGLVKSTLSIGNVSATFTSRTRLVSLGTFVTSDVAGVPSDQREVYATATSNDSTIHTITITGTGASFSVGVENTNARTNFTASDGSSVTSFLNNRRIYVRKPVGGTDPTLTIDNVTYPVKFP